MSETTLNSSEQATIVTETALPQLQETTAEMFSVIDDKGDIIDRLKSLRKVAGMGTLATGAALTGFYEGLGHGDSFHVPGAIVLVASTTAATEVHRRVQRRRERGRVNKYREFQHELQENFDGETVEVHRQRIGRQRTGDEVTLKWDGNPDTDEPLAEYLSGRLHQLEAIVKTGEIEHTALPASYVDEYAEGLGEVKTQDAWFGDFKKMKVKDPVQGDREFLLVDHEELSKLIERVDASIETEEPMRSIMRVLKEYAPTHPANLWYEQRNTKGETSQKMSQKKMKAIFKNALERNLTEFHGSNEKNEDFDFFRKRGATGGTVVPGVEGSNPKIRWLQPEKQLQDVATDLFNHQKITMADLERVLEHPEKFPAPKVKALCELSGWMLLEGYEVKINGDGNGDRGTNGQSTPSMPVKDSAMGFQERFAVQHRGTRAQRRALRRAQEHEPINDVRPFLRRAGRAVLMTAGVAAAAYVVARGAENINVNKDNKIRAEMHSQGKDETGAHGKDEAEYYRRRSEDPYQNIFDDIVNPIVDYEFKVYDFTDQLLNGREAISNYDELQRLDTEGMDFSGDNDCLECEAPVGNVPDRENKPVWYLKSYNGMEVAGYWSSMTYDETYPVNTIKWKDFTPEYSPGANRTDPNAEGKLSPVIQQSVQLPPALAADVNGQTIRVQRNITVGSAGRLEDQYRDYKFAEDSTGTYKVVPVPVLNGTKIAYATIGENKPVRLYQTENGVNLLLIKDDGGLHSIMEHDLEKLEYWIVPDPNSKGPRMKSRLDAEIYDTKPSDRYYSNSQKLITELETEQKGVNEAWKKAIPNLPTDPVERELAEEEYLKFNFKYSLSPISAEDQKDLAKTQDYTKEDNTVDRQANYSRVILNNKLGNCNVVGTLLAISNPTELNYTVGFMNGASRPDGNGYLSQNEAHAWTVDKDANIHDATPSGKGPDTNENFDDTAPADQKAEDQKRNEMIGLGLLGAAGLVAFANRRRIKKAKNAVQAKRAEHHIAKADNEDVQMAAVVVAQPGFAERVADFESALDAVRPEDRDVKIEAIGNLSRDSYKDAKRTLKRVVATTKREKQAKKAAKKLVKATYRANRVAPKELQHIDG